MPRTCKLQDEKIWQSDTYVYHELLRTVNCKTIRSLTSSEVCARLRATTLISLFGRWPANRYVRKGWQLSHDQIPKEIKQARIDGERPYYFPYCPHFRRRLPLLLSSSLLRCAIPSWITFLTFLSTCFINVSVLWAILSLQTFLRPRAVSIHSIY